MDFNTLIAEHFGGNASELARACGVTPGAMFYWKKYGIPVLRQNQIELLLIKKSSPAPVAGTAP